MRRQQYFVHHIDDRTYRVQGPDGNVVVIGGVCKCPVAALGIVCEHVRAVRACIAQRYGQRAQIEAYVHTLKHTNRRHGGDHA